LYLFRPTVDPATLSNVLIVGMDEQSYRELEQDPDRPWDRRLHADLLRRLKASGAKVVVFDVSFDERSSDPAADAALAAAIRDHGRVVLAASLVSSSNRETGPPVVQLLPPVDSIGSNAPWGVVEWPLDQGSAPVIRLQFWASDYTSLAWQAAAAAGQAPVNPSTRRWMNYYGPGGTVPNLSYYRALRAEGGETNIFAGKVVFIGAIRVITARGPFSDLHPTPFSRWIGGLTSGAELHATAFLNLVRRDWLQELSPGSESLLLILCGGLSGMGLARLRPWWGALLAFGAVAGIAAGSATLAWVGHLWFPWLILPVQIACALAWSVIAYTLRLTQEADQIKKEIAVAESMASLRSLQSGSEPGPGAVKAAPESAPEPSALLAPRPPILIPNHQLIRCIGRGGYGEVWLAKDEIGSYHAVKLVYQRGFSSLAPYEREFRGIQKFTPISREHPGFVHVLHVGRNDSEGYFFYIMELGDDERTGPHIDPATYSANSLARQLERGRLSVPACVQLGLELTAALEYLHSRQLVHRDIKPANIIYANYRPKFADIGLVTDIALPGTDSSLVGTEGYLPPEGPGRPTADIYSLGKVLYEACTGRDRRDFPALSSTLVGSADPDLTLFNDIVLIACHPNPKERYQSASEMRAELMTVFQRASSNLPADRSQSRSDH
jgi:CHASE2 domain-containing sensor protein